MAGKNKAAQTMANLRWSKTTADERKKHGKKMNKARNKKLSEDERSAIAKTAAAASAKVRSAKAKQG